MITRRVALLSAAMAVTAVTSSVRAETAQLLVNQPLRELYAALDKATRAETQNAVRPSASKRLHLWFARAFDLETVLKVSIGLRWDGLDADSWVLLRRVLLIYYCDISSPTSRYDGECFLMGFARNAGPDRIVGTEIITGGDHLRVDYVMRDDGATWRAVDVLGRGLDQPGRRAAVGFPENPDAATPTR